MTTLTLSPTSGYVPAAEYEPYPPRLQDKVNVDGDTMTGTLVIDKALSSSIIDYTIHLKASGGTTNAGRALFSQGSTYGLAVSLNSTASSNAFAAFQWIDVATGATQTTPLRLDFNGSIRVPGGAKIMGDFSSAANLRTIFQSSVTNGVTGVVFLPNGTATDSALRAFNSSDVDNGSFGDIAVSSTAVMLRSSKSGTGSYMPMSFYTSDLERVRLDTNGVLGLGVTPNVNWGSSTKKVFQIGIGGYIYGDSTVADQLAMGANHYFDGVNVRYLTTSTATRIFAASGTISLSVAASGTAGNVVTFTDAIAINNAATVTFGGAIAEKVNTTYSTALNPTLGTVQRFALTGNTTFTDSLTSGTSITLMIDDGTNFTITWPTITWISGSAPTLSTSLYTVINIWKVGTVLYGSFVGYA